jgi:hypothetical protein
VLDGNPSTDISAGVGTLRGHPLRGILVTLSLVDSAGHRDELRACKVISKRLSAGGGPIKYSSSKLRASWEWTPNHNHEAAPETHASFKGTRWSICSREADVQVAPSYSENQVPDCAEQSVPLDHVGAITLKYDLASVALSYIK